jgi:Recombination endonuclease VII
MGDRTCSLPECYDPHLAKDFCRKHYQRWKKWGDPLAGVSRGPRKLSCAIEDCEDPWKTKDWCNKHYQRWLAWGDPLGAAPSRAADPSGDGRKTCRLCNSSKALDEFSPAKRGLYGRRSECKKCAGLQARKRYRADPEKHKAASLEWHRKNPDKSRERRRRVALSRYGWTPEMFADQLEKQGGACAICRHPEPRAKQWAVDHDHRTGRVREILCQSCNCGLGFAEDDVDRLKAMIAYLEKHRAAPVATEHRVLPTPRRRRYARPRLDQEGSSD